MKSFQDLFPTATDGIMGLTQKVYWGPWRSTSRTADERPTLSVVLVEPLMRDQPFL